MAAALAAVGGVEAAALAVAGEAVVVADAARRTPVRNLLGRISERVSARRGGSSGGSSGGSYGSLGSAGTVYVSTPVTYASGGSWGSSYAYTSSGASYGSWGSSYLGSAGSSYSGTIVSSPMEAGTTYGYTDSGMIDSGIPIEVPGMLNGTMPYDSGFIDGGIPMDSGGGFSTPGIESPRSIINEGGRSYDPGGIEIPPTPRPTEDAEETLILPRARNNAVLSLNVPRDAKVYINDQLTKTEGEVRDYVSRRLKKGEHYEYHVKAIVNRDGREIVRTHAVKLEPGIKKRVTLDFEKTAVTTLAKSPRGCTSHPFWQRNIGGGAELDITRLELWKMARSGKTTRFWSRLFAMVKL